MACASPALVPGPAKFGVLLPPLFEEDSGCLGLGGCSSGCLGLGGSCGGCRSGGFGLALGLGRGFLFGLQRDRRIQAAAQSVHVGVDGGDLGCDVFAESGHQHGREHRSALQALHGLLEIGGVDRGGGHAHVETGCLDVGGDRRGGRDRLLRIDEGLTRIIGGLVTGRVGKGGLQRDRVRRQSEALRAAGGLRLSRGRRQGDACAGGGDEGECDSGRDDRGAPASAASGDSESATGRSGGRDGAHVSRPGSVWGDSRPRAERHASREGTQVPDSSWVF